MSARVTIVRNEKNWVLMTKEFLGVLSEVRRRTSQTAYAISSQVALGVLEKFFSQGVSWRNWAYDNKVLPSWSVDLPVVSVGNVTVGGSGKSPFCDWLLTQMQARGWNSALISRGYGVRVGRANADLPTQTLLKQLGLTSAGFCGNMLLVDPKGRPDVYGDEPLWLARRHSSVPIVLSPDRVNAARFLAAQRARRYVLLDDGFQHRRLQRDLDIVLVDVSQSLSHYSMLPLGMAREPLAALLRADVVVFTKTNLAQENGPCVRSVCKRYLSSSLVLESTVELQGIVDLKGNRAVLDVKRVNTVCGIANPKAFAIFVERVLGLQIDHALILPDHFDYNQDQVRQILEREGIWLTTEKDAVKLSRFEELQGKVFVVQTKMNVSGETDALFSRLDRLIR